MSLRNKFHKFALKKGHMDDTEDFIWIRLDTIESFKEIDQDHLEIIFLGGNGLAEVVATPRQLFNVIEGREWNAREKKKK